MNKTKKCTNCIKKHIAYVEAYKEGLIADLEKLSKGSDGYSEKLSELKATEEILTLIKDNYYKQIM